MPQPKIATTVKQGDQFPPAYHGGPKQIVQGVRHFVSDGGTVEITTNSGTFVFHPLERVTFPRRTGPLEGQIIDHAKTVLEKGPVLGAPLISQLFVGDILFPQEFPHNVQARFRNVNLPQPTTDPEIPTVPYGTIQLIDPRLYPDWWEMSPEEQNEDMVTFLGEVHPYCQRVTAVVQIGGADSGFWVHTRDWSQARRWWVESLDSRIIFPAVDGSPLRAKRKNAEMEVYGPYARPGGPEVYFFKHPYGRGRWPANAHNYDRDASGEMRPPHGPAQWKTDQWRLLSLEAPRHPSDPGVPRLPSSSD